MFESLGKCVQSGCLPNDPDEILPLLTNSDGTYLFQEGDCWDFKETWPFSYSDDYFHGLARLVCAFNNTEGGLIIFGVDDKTRKGGRTKTIPNLDRFEQAIKQLTGQSPQLKLRRYSNEECGDVDILLVESKGDYDRPMRFLRAAGGYKEGVIWVRRNSEVQEGDAGDIPTLYLNQGDEDSVERQPSGQMPPSQSTVRDFVGRMYTIDRLFEWLLLEDEPRAFLFGKGGSGKSTIAMEIFRHIRASGGAFKLGRENLIDQVMFLSAKAQFLDVERQSVEDFSGTDFTSEDELYRAILLLGGAAPDNLETLNGEELKRVTKEFFKETAVFLVIDDIDTLTTAGEEAGLDFIYRAISRSSKISKVLYTLRNRPSHSIKSSVEVPGLSGDEYREFVAACVQQFRVAEPPATFVEGKLTQVSEGRPLVIESIIALKRHAGSYEKALELFERGAGDDVRSYVFRREWEAIEPASKGREILACLALYGKPMSFSDLAAVSRLEESKVRDAIAAVQEMFLITDEDERDTLFRLGSLTHAFVESQMASLDRFATIKARVENFKRSAYPESPLLAKLNRELRKAEFDARAGDFDALRDFLWKAESDRLGPETLENPRFLAMRGYAYCLGNDANLAKASDDFRAAFQLGYTPSIEYVKKWFSLARDADTANKSTKEIVKIVLDEKRYPLSDRSEMRLARAVFLYNTARRQFFTDPYRSLEMLEEAVGDHIRAFYGLSKAKSSVSSRSERFTRNTAFFYLQKAFSLNEPDKFLEYVTRQCHEKDLYLDPLVEPLIEALQMSFSRGASSAENLNRLASKADFLGKELQKSSQFIWGSSKEMLIEQIHALRAAVKVKLGELKKR